MGLKQSEGTILSVSRTKLDVAREDQEALKTVGIDEEYLEEFEEEIEAADALYTHTENQGVLTGITDAKNRLTDLCYSWIRTLRSRMDRVFGVNSPEYSRLPANIAEGRDREALMIPAMEQAIHLAKEFREELAEARQTDEDIEEGTELVARLKGGDDRQELKKIRNLSDTRIRHELFNSVYDRVNQINRIGRDLFKDDEAKLARYRSRWP